jgi:hypothetical protein
MGAEGRKGINANEPSRKKAWGRISDMKKMASRLCI